MTDRADRHQDDTSGDGPIVTNRRWLWFAIAFLAFLPVLLAALAFWFASEYRRLGSDDHDAERAHARQFLISELFSATKDAESGSAVSS